MFTTSLLFVASGILFTGVSSCETNAACNYNGVCQSGSCVCESGWQGSACETFDFLPAVWTGGFHSPHGASSSSGNSSSWGGSVLFDETSGLWHMFAAEMLMDCGIDYWDTNSQVVHAVSSTPEGPYKKTDVVLPVFAHEPNAVRSSKGEWVIYATYRNPPGGPSYNCTSNPNPPPPPLPPSPPSPPSPPTPTPLRQMSTYMVHSASPYGPWSEPVEVLKPNSSTWGNSSVMVDTNLAVVILPDDSVVGIWRKCENTPHTACQEACCTFPHLLTATDWKDPSSYQPHAEQLFPLLQPFGSEDPMLWLTQHSDHLSAAAGAPQSVIHAILHDEQGPNRCTAVGRHAFSGDGGATWTYASEDAYNGTVQWKMGGSTDLYRRERPHVILDRSGRPSHVSNGVQETTASDRSWTLIQPLVGSEQGKGS